MKNKLTKLLVLFLGAAPLVAWAQDPEPLLRIVRRTQGVVDVVVPVLMVIATIVFIWGIIQYVLAGADETKKGAAKSIIIYGLVGLFVIVAVWGIVRILVLFFGVQGVTQPFGPGQI